MCVLTRKGGEGEGEGGVLDENRIVYDRYLMFLCTVFSRLLIVLFYNQALDSYCCFPVLKYKFSIKLSECFYMLSLII